MNPAPHRPILLLLLCSVVLAGCQQAPPSGLPVTQMQIGDKSFNLEIATQPHDQEVGLMHRDHLDADHGMIFVFATEQTGPFWNHDVHFPLDLIFLDGDGVIVSLKHMEAYKDLNVYSDEPYRYTIELNRGLSAQLGLHVGQHLVLPKGASSRPPQAK